MSLLFKRMDIVTRELIHQNTDPKSNVRPFTLARTPNAMLTHHCTISIRILIHMRAATINLSALT